MESGSTFTACLINTNPPLHTPRSELFFSYQLSTVIYYKKAKNNTSRLPSIYAEFRNAFRVWLRLKRILKKALSPPSLFTGHNSGWLHRVLMCNMLCKYGFLSSSNPPLVKREGQWVWSVKSITRDNGNMTKQKPDGALWPTACFRWWWQFQVVC